MSDVLHIEHTDVGATLTTWLYTSFWQMYAAEQHGFKSYIHWPRDKKRALHHYFDEQKFDEEPNMYQWYFKQPMVGEEPGRVWCWTEASEMGSWLGEHQLYADVKVTRNFFQRYLHLNDEVNKRGLALAEKYSLSFRHTIGVTWRGTDSTIDGRPRLPISTYFPFLDEILEMEAKNGNRMRVACTAEEEGILDPLLLRYPNAFRIEEFATAPTPNPGSVRIGDNPERFSPLSGFERGMQPATMVWLFSKCEHYVKNRSSVAAVASWLSNGRIVSIAHPENMGHDEESKKYAEIEGKRIPLEK